MHNWKRLIAAIIIPGLMAACSPSPASDVNKQSSPGKTDVKPGEIAIQPDIDAYIPTMSSTVGIGLIPLYTLGRSPETVKFTWHCTYGYFLGWEAPDFKVKNLGKDIEYGNKKIYWSYSPEDMGIQKPDVLITLDVADKNSGEVIVKSNLNIVWENKDTAKVKK